VAATAPNPNEILMWNDTDSQWEPAAVPSAPVSSVAGRTGAVTLDYGDINNASGKYLTYKPNNVACGNDEILKFDGTNWVCTSVASALNGDYALSGANTDIISLGTVTSITSTAGLTLSSSANGDIALQPNGTGLVTTSSALRVTPTTLPLTPSAGTIVMDSSTGNAMKYYDGSTWQTLGTGTGTGDFMKNGSVAMTGDFDGGTHNVTNIGSVSGSALTLTSTGTNNGITLTPNGTGLVTTSSALRVTPTTLPGAPAAGTIAFDSGAANAMKYYDGSAWQTLGTGTGAGDFMKDGSVAMTGNLKLGANYISNDGGASEGLAFDTSGNANFTGNVGIGTNAPSSALGLGGGADQTIGVERNPSAAAGKALTLQGGGAGNGANLNGGDLQLFGGNSTGNGTSGIGLYLPLDTQGGGSTVRTPASGTPIAYFKGDGRNIALGMGAQTSGRYSMTFSLDGASTYTVSQDNAMAIMGGNVGIGTVSPGSLLDVNGPIHIKPTTLPVSPTAGQLAFDSGAANALKFYDGSAWQTVGTGTGSGDFMKNGSVAMTGNLQLGANYISNDGGASEGLAFDTSGNANFTGKIGIGTATSSSNLSFTGQSNQTIAMERNSTSNTAGKNLTIQAGGAATGATNKAGGDLNLSTGVSTGSGSTPNINFMLSDSGAAATSDNATYKAMSLNSLGLQINYWGAGTNNFTNGLLIENTKAGSDGAAVLSLAHSYNGISGVVSGDGLGQIDFWGYTATGGRIRGAQIRSAIPDATASTEKTTISFATMAGGTLADRMTIDGDGEVGIGTTSPARPLHVNGAARLTPTTTPGSPAAGDLFFDSTASNALKFYNGTAWQTVGTGTGSGDFMKDGSVAMTGNIQLNGHYLSGDGGNEGVYVDSSGNVGIGTGTPGAPLEVMGDQYLTHSTNDAWGANIALRKDRAGAVVQSNDEIGYLRFDAWDGSAYRPAASIDANIDGTPGSNDMPGRLSFLTTPDGSSAPVERMRITNAGSVGIGTTTPFVKLGVVSSSDTSGIQIRRNSASTSSVAVIGLRNATSDSATNSAQIASIRTNSPAASDAAMAFSITSNTALTEVMRLDSTGRVGIGTTAPSEKLEVGGNIKMTGTGNGITFPDGTTQTTAATSGGAGDFKADGSVAMTGALAMGGHAIDNAGNLTINNKITTSSNEMVLEQTGDTYGTTRLRLRNRDGSNGAVFDSPSLDLVDFGFLPSSGTQSNLRWEHRSSSVLMPSNSSVGEFQLIGISGGTGTTWFATGQNASAFLLGNVGIGTNNPSEKLDVSGKVKASEFCIGASCVSSWPSGGSSPWTATGSDIYYSSGKVGIGTSTPAVDLDVNGVLRVGTAAIHDASHAALSFKGNGAYGLIEMNGARGAGAALSSGMTFWNSTTKIAEFDAYTGTGTTSGALTFSTANSGTLAEAMRIDQTGNVGIGTTAPGAKLDVRGSSGSTLKIVDGNQGAGKILTSDADGVASWSNPAGTGDFLADGTVPMTGALRLGSNLLTNSGGSYGLSMDTSGRTTITNLSGSVTAGLTLTNTSAASGSGTSLSFKSSSVQGASIATTVNTTTSDIDLAFSTRGSNTIGERMRIMGNGNVGIGTTAASATLDVNGTIKATAADFPIQRVSATGAASAQNMTASVTCPTDYVVIGGGCETVAWGGVLIVNKPQGSTGWACSATHPYAPATYSTTAYAICMKTQ
jgi:hypothetical protein